MPPPQEQLVTKQVIEEHHRELNKCLGEVEESAKQAKEAARQAVQVAEKCKQVEEDTKKMIAQFGTNE
eukprot:s3029_g4.t1